MKITLYGAANEVTGSAYLVETDRARVLVDFGLFQGGRMTEAKNRVPGGLRPQRLSAVLLTHCHLDHVGRLPLLPGRGFPGPIYATEATIELTDLILRDAAKIQEIDTERLNRKRMRQDKPPVEPLFRAEDAADAVRLMRPVRYDEPVEAAPGIRARFAEAGHLLGSASIQLLVQENNQHKIVVFSGDLGQPNAPILRDYECLHRADAVFMESTYGDHDHRSLEETIAEFEQIVATAVEQRGKILVPTFAVGRAQLILYILAGMFERGFVPEFPVFLDSPMAIEATNIYTRHPELFDAEAAERSRNRYFIKDFRSLQLCRTADESRALNDLSGPCLIMAGAGMCNAGRILHHFRQNLWKKETWVLIVGYQARGSLGRLLVEGVKKVRIFGETIAVKAAVRTLGGFSAHAGQKDLLNWFECLAPARPRLFLTHGEPPAQQALAEEIERRFKIRAATPGMRETIEL